MRGTPVQLSAKREKVKEEEVTLLSLSVILMAASLCPASRLSITEREPRMCSAPIKSASRRGENTHGAQSHGQVQLKCCSAAEIPEATWRSAKKPNYQLVIYCQ